MTAQSNISKDVILDMIVAMDEGIERESDAERYATASCYCKALANVLDHLGYMPETAKDRRKQAERYNNMRYSGVSSKVA